MLEKYLLDIPIIGKYDDSDQFKEGFEDNVSPLDKYDSECHKGEDRIIEICSSDAYTQNESDLMFMIDLSE